MKLKQYLKFRRYRYWRCSVLTVFVVLCLTVLSVLTLFSAQNEQTLTKSADAIKAYYEADSAATKAVREIMSADLTNMDLKKVTSLLKSYQPNRVSFSSDGEVATIVFTLPIDKTKELYVSLHLTNEHLTITSWKTQSTVNLDSQHSQEHPGYFDGENVPWE